MELSRRRGDTRAEFTGYIDQQIDLSMIQMGMIKGESRKIAQEAVNVFMPIDKLIAEDIDELKQRLAIIEKGSDEKR